MNLSELKTRRFGRSFQHHPSLDSTNRFLKDLAARGAEEGTTVLADEQSAGRGRWGRTWESAPGKGILVSVLLRPPLGARISQLTAVMGLAVLKALRPYASQARLKWPNDIWVEEKKLSGLLLESSDGAVIAGLGLNVSQVPEDFSAELNATSLKLTHGSEVDKEILLVDLLLKMEQAYEEWKAEGFEKARREWEENACFMGEWIQASNGVTGKVLGMDAEGALLIRDDNGVRSLNSGELTRLRPA